eukprot:6196651-Pleurochrysis_carterae.AAC.7
MSPSPAVTKRTLSCEDTFAPVRSAPRSAPASAEHGSPHWREPVHEARALVAKVWRDIVDARQRQEAPRDPRGGGGGVGGHGAVGEVLGGGVDDAALANARSFGLGFAG